MKVLWMVVIFAVFSVSAFAESLTYRDDIKPMTYNDILKKQLVTGTRVDYDPEKDQFEFYIKQGISLVGFKLSRNQADSLIETIDKYQAWDQKAKKKAVTLEKEIAQVPTGEVYWRFGNGDWSFGPDANLRMVFFSQNTERHQLVMQFSKFVSSRNSYLGHNPQALYFDYDEALKLRDSLKKESVAQFIIQAKNQAAIDAEFN
ncbi:hypothetical protein ACJJID_00100 (plasmid) [Microbulbifer sp. CnH-101-G]|uniref:hypothetical protein n=1 Tax=Microbulbifer sp. CnH-101-G TaxID=3243393 RepID=UPI004039C427